MKTITEYAPMIFTQIAHRSEQRIATRRQFGINAWMTIGYCTVGVWLGIDTGFAPWGWQFWLIFLPLFVAGELGLREALERGRVRSSSASNLTSE